MTNDTEELNLIGEESQTRTEKHPLEEMPDFDSEVAARHVAEAKENLPHVSDNDEMLPKVIIDGDYLGLENSHNGSHFMTQEENVEYERLWRTNVKSAIKYLREKWAEHVDRDFIQSFRCVHWVSNNDMIKHLEEMLGDGKHEKEISTQAYNNSEKLKTNKRWLDAKVGLLIDGTVNLASNADIQTNQWHGVVVEKDDDRKRRKYTEWANRLMTNEGNCVSPYEFVIGDWAAKAIVADPEAITPELRALAEKHGIPIIATDDEQLFNEQNKGSDEA